MDDLNRAVQKYFTDCRKGENNLITSEELFKAMEAGEDLFLLDIRREEDFAREYIDGAVNIYWYDVGDYLDVLPKDRRVIVICYTGQSSGQVAAVLRLLGFRAYSLGGGMMNGWMKKSMPTKAGCAG